MEVLETINLDSADQTNATLALESGKVLYFPHLPFELLAEESSFLSPSIVDPRSKNISYDLRTHALRGTLCEGSKAEGLKGMIRRYALFSRSLIDKVLPSYLSSIVQARTSFRPVEALGRPSSYRKDDTRLHIDAFPANPVRGKRILRVFTNVNPDGKPRVWRLGEPFENVASTFTPRLSGPFPGMATLMHALKITKSRRSPYDYYMLKLHDSMKGDMQYQKSVSQQEVLFPPGSTWIVFSDQVSHAAMSGQHLFEQTFHLPPEALQHPDRSPLKVLERLLGKSLL